MQNGRIVFLGLLRLFFWKVLYSAICSRHAYFAHWKLKSNYNISKSTSWFRGWRFIVDLTHSHIWGPCTSILWLVRFFVTLWFAADSISWNLVVRISPIWKPKALHGKNYLPPLPSSTDQGDTMFLLNKNMNLPKKEESLLGGQRANETDYYSRYPLTQCKCWGSLKTVSCLRQRGARIVKASHFRFFYDKYSPLYPIKSPDLPIKVSYILAECIDVPWSSKLYQSRVECFWQQFGEKKKEKERKHNCEKLV